MFNATLIPSSYVIHNYLISSYCTKLRSCAATCFGHHFSHYQGAIIL